MASQSFDDLFERKSNGATKKVLSERNQHLAGVAACQPAWEFVCGALCDIRRGRFPERLVSNRIQTKPHHPPSPLFPPFPSPPAGPAPLFLKCAPPTLHCPAHQYPSALVPAPACLWKKLQRLFSGATQRGAECGKSAALHRTTLTQSHTVTHTRTVWFCGWWRFDGARQRD